MPLERNDDPERFRDGLASPVKHGPVAGEHAPLTGSSGKAELRILRARAQAERLAKHKPVDRPE